MKIQNKTTYRTDHIRVFLTRVAAEELEPEKAKRIEVRVIWKRGGQWIAGWAYYHGTLMCLKLPRRETIDKRLLAKIIAHEMAHLRGLHHRQMHCARYDRNDPNWRERYAWADDLSLEHVEVKPIVKPSSADVAQAKLHHAECMARLAATRLKRARTLARKWDRKIRYYQKRLAACKAMQA